MAKYIALKAVLISHLSKTVQENEEFEADFPKGFKPEPNLVLVSETKKKPKADDDIN